MLVQHFLPASSTTTITNSSFSPPLSSPASSLTKNKKTPILSPFFNSESTGFQPTTDESIRMGYSDKIKTHLSAWPRKLTPVMELHRQRFSQLNPRFKQQEQQITLTLKQPIQQSVIYPVILPSTSRPQPRQEARSKQNQSTHLPPAQPNRRSTTAYVKQQQQQQQQQHSSPLEPQSQYITLANLSKLLHVLQTQEKITDHETSTETSTSTTNSAKQRVQQHLQETATRWWKPIRTTDSHPPAPAPSATGTHTKSSVPSDVTQQRKEIDNLPLLTVVSHSPRRPNLPPSSGYATSKYDESESSTEIQTIISSIVQPPKLLNSKRTRQEPLIMPARGMRFRSYEHNQYYNNHNNMNLFQQPRLIRQT